jgi:hypothetical protein
MAPSTQKRPALVQIEPNKFYTGAELKELFKKAAEEKPNPLKRGPDDSDLREHSDHDDSDSSSDGEIYITENCDQVRRKINTFIDNGGMTVKDFVAAINVSSVGYYRFMKQHGKHKGASSDTYVRAFRFFQKRAQKGVPMPKKRKLAAPAAAKLPSSTINLAPVLDIKLDGELEDAVPVFDSCDEIRRKINAHLRKPDVTQAQFLRELHAQFHGPRKPKSIQSAQLSKFRGQSGSVTGNTSGIYYAAYVFFEKQRVAAGKPKSEHRQDMEDAWKYEGGVDVKKNLNNVSYFCSNSSNLYRNEFGKVGRY